LDGIGDLQLLAGVEHLAARALPFLVLTAGGARLGTEHPLVLVGDLIGVAVAGDRPGTLLPHLPPSTRRRTGTKRLGDRVTLRKR
jgi:hypothetical protein